MEATMFTIHASDDKAEAELDLVNGFLEEVKIKRMFASFVSGSPGYWSMLVISDRKAGGRSSKNGSRDIELTPIENALYETLRTWRSQQAEKENLSSYIIAHNFCLKQMAKLCPKTHDDLLQVKAFGEKRTEKYGQEILEVISNFPGFET